MTPEGDHPQQAWPFLSQALSLWKGQWRKEVMYITVSGFLTHKTGWFVLAFPTGGPAPELQGHCNRAGC
jgi:hypothetical protein